MLVVSQMTPPRPGLDHPDLPGEHELTHLRWEAVLEEDVLWTTFRAFDTHERQPLEVVVARKSLWSTQFMSSVLAHFDRELSILETREPPGLRPLAFAGSLEDGRPILATWPMPPTRLETLLTHRVDTEQIAALILPLARTLATLEGRGLAHGGVRPDNISFVYTTAPRLTLLHCGLVRWSMSDADALERSGCWRYMAPEHMRGYLEPRSDAYSLGAILWQMLVGQPLGRDDSMDTFVQRRLDSQNSPDPRDVWSRCDPELSELCTDLLDPNPRERLSARSLVPLLEPFVAASQSPLEPTMLSKRDSRVPLTGNTRRVATTRPLGNASPKPPEATVSDLRILLVEKDTLIASSLLGTLAQFELELTTSVTAASEWLSRETFDVVLASELLDSAGRLALVDSLERAIGTTRGPRPRLYLYTQAALSGVERVGWVKRLSIAWPSYVLIDHLNERPVTPPAPAVELPETEMLDELLLALGELEAEVSDGFEGDVEAIVNRSVELAQKLEATRFKTRLDMFRQAYRAQLPTVKRLLDNLLAEYEALRQTRS